MDVISFKDDCLVLLDQRHLPKEERYIQLKNSNEVIDAIKNMAVRGAPLIGITAAYGYFLGSLEVDFNDIKFLKDHLRSIKKKILNSRPTAVNLRWALDKMEKIVNGAATLGELKLNLLKEAHSIKESQISADNKISNFGVELLRSQRVRNGKITPLTHCNAGSLATGGEGTALGVIKAAHRGGLIEKVYVDETRPRLQGAMLTCFELKKEGIDYRLICETMSGMLMRKGKIDVVIVGADRIAANGDVANKIGTYVLAVLALRHNIPFYVAAPVSTFDFDTPRGDDIDIEERSPDEVLYINGKLIAPVGTKVENPAFDITPYELITSYITEKGIIKNPDEL